MFWLLIWQGIAVFSGGLFGKELLSVLVVDLTRNC